MIYTVTFNPALDYIVRVENFCVGQVNRTCYEKMLPGGKGINVSIVLKNMGIDSTALGFVAGFTGQEIQNQLKKYGIRTAFIPVKDGISRINLKMKSNEETEINGQGPRIAADELEALYCQLDQLQDGDVLVISGSIPNTLPQDIYERIMMRLDGKKIDVVVDATGDLLFKVLKYRPFLVKPNNHELGELYGAELSTQDEVIPYAKKLQEEGARNVLISMAGKGAVFLSEHGAVLKSPAPKGNVINSVGAGDSMVAGFLTGYMESGGDYGKSFRMGLCTGSASAFSEELATRTEADALLAGLSESTKER